MLRYGARDDASLLLQVSESEVRRKLSQSRSQATYHAVSPNQLTCLLLLLQYGFVMGAARGEANVHGQLPATLCAALRATEPAAAPEAADPVAADPVAAGVAGDGGGHAPACKRQRVVGLEPDMWRG